jgi:hypothetical protein
VHPRGRVDIRNACARASFELLVVPSDIGVVSLERRSGGADPGGSVPVGVPAGGSGLTSWLRVAGAFDNVAEAAYQHVHAVFELVGTVVFVDDRRTRGQQRKIGDGQSAHCESE